MKKTLKYIGICLAVLVVALLVASAIISYCYKDEIMQVVTEKIGKQVKADIYVGKIDLSFWGNIPDISIQLHNVYAKSTKTFKRSEFSNMNTDTALYAKRILLSFNVLDFLFKNYVVQQIIVHDANVNFFLDSKSHHNWDFSIESDSSGNDMFVELSKIQFRNTKAKYCDVKSKMNAEEWFNKINFSGKFHEKDFSVDVYADFTNKDFVYKEKQYFADNAFKLDVSIQHNNKKYAIHKLTLETPVGTIISDGSVGILPDNAYNVDLSVNVETSAEKIMSILPRKTTDSLAPYKLRSDIFVEGNINGKIDKKTMPSLKCNVALLRGSVLFQKTKYEFQTRGKVKASDLAKIRTYTFTSQETKIRTGESLLVVNTANIKNFENPEFSIVGDVNLHVNDVEYLTDFSGYKIQGDFAGTVSCDGSVDGFSEFTPDVFVKNTIKVDLQCKDADISAPEESPYNFSDVSGHILFADRNLSVDSVSGLLQSKPFTLQGRASDFVSYVMFDSVDSHCNINCTIESIDLVPFYEHYEKYLSSSTGEGSLFGTIRFETQKLDFDPYYLTNTVAVIRLADNYIELSDINASSLQGKFSEGYVKLTDLPESKTKCVASGKISKMSAKDIFTTFNNFDQTVITDKKMAGSLSGEFQFSSIFDAEYNPLYSTIDAMANVVIENGSVENVAPLIEIGKKLKIEEDFSKVSFSTLQNTIRLKDDTLYIPNMNVKSTAFDITFAGKHNIDKNCYVYHMTVFLQKTLSLKFHNKNKDEEDFGEIEKNNDGNLKIPLRIVGTPDDYSIEFDRGKTKENVKQGLETQRQEWKEIIGDNNNRSTETKEQEEQEQKVESGFQIEFD